MAAPAFDAEILVDAGLGDIVDRENCAIRNPSPKAGIETKCFFYDEVSDVVRNGEVVLDPLDRESHAIVAFDQCLISAIDTTRRTINRILRTRTCYQAKSITQQRRLNDGNR